MVTVVANTCFGLLWFLGSFQKWRALQRKRHCETDPRDSLGPKLTGGRRGRYQKLPAEQLDAVHLTNHPLRHKTIITTRLRMSEAAANSREIGKRPTVCSVSFIPGHGASADGPGRVLLPSVTCSDSCDATSLHKKQDMSNLFLRGGRISIRGQGEQSATKS
jgi:hypothetical protein